MANFTIKFHSVSSEYPVSIGCIKEDESIFISIHKGLQDVNPLDCQSIKLDKSTAIKLAKTLRTEINKIEG